MTFWRSNRFAAYAWGVLSYTLAVIIWGAFVRASGSGAGCGNHWPLCNGEVVPLAPQLSTLIEFAHRTMSGLSLLLVGFLIVWAFRSYPPAHRVRLGAAASAIFLVTEALIGAGLVLFGWVAKDVSAARAISVALHLANTFLLLAALALTAYWTSGGAAVEVAKATNLKWALALGLLGTLVVAVTGAVTALGDTLFPAQSLAAGLAQDVSTTANFLIRLRVFHPLFAIAAGAYLIILASFVISWEPGPVASRWAGRLRLFVAAQLAAGAVNILLLAPVWLQLAHLLLADLVWIALVLLTASLLAEKTLEAGQLDVQTGGRLGAPAR